LRKGGFLEASGNVLGPEVAEDIARLDKILGCNTQAVDG
jgi:hypothetical protein